jgi:hypothetical protein
MFLHNVKDNLLNNQMGMVAMCVVSFIFSFCPQLEVQLCKERQLAGQLRRQLMEMDSATGERTPHIHLLVINPLFI